MELKADYKTGEGLWGNNIGWSQPEQFQKISDHKTFKVYGHCPRIPKVGQTLLGEFVNSWIKFEFVEVRPCGNPSDMFFAEVKPIEQVMK
jgi:hypothetical protein